MEAFEEETEVEAAEVEPLATAAAGAGNAGSISPETSVSSDAGSGARRGREPSQGGGINTLADSSLSFISPHS